MSPINYWLFKSEPTAYSYQDLQNEDDHTAEWDRVRNYQARNLMRDEIWPKAFFCSIWRK